MPTKTRQSRESNKRKIANESASSEPFVVSDEDELASDSDYSHHRQKPGKGKGKAGPGRGYISDAVLDNHRTVSSPGHLSTRVRSELTNSSAKSADVVQPMTYCKKR